jgi:hypothetical protein
VKEIRNLVAAQLPTSSSSAEADGNLMSHEDAEMAAKEK